jgi:hypothetical protein
MATNFLEYSGGTNGFLTAPFNLMTTELNALANFVAGTSGTALSSVGGTSGVFTQTNWGSGIWGVIDFVSGGAFTPTAGGYLAGWFLFSPDGGTTFEKNVATQDMPRSPDFIIPLFASAYAASDVSQSSGIVRIPWWSNKVFFSNHSGVALPATGNIIKGASVAIQY